MNKRLFTFGCSFTNYKWPTWADILSQEYDYFENWGAIGGGNHFILYSLMEAIRRRNINQNDVVAVMFTSFGREDRFVKDRWLLQGSVYNSSFPQAYVDNFTDPNGYLITNLAVIDAVNKLLELIGCKVYLLSTTPCTLIDDSYLKKFFTFKKTLESTAYTLYQDTLEKIKPSVYEIIFNSDWASRNSTIIPMAQKCALDSFKENYQACAGKDWPNFNEFIAKGNKSNVPKKIMDEINHQFNFLTKLENILNLRQDKHPVPMEHYEYLEKTGFTLSRKQKEYATTWNQQVLSKSEINFSPKNTDRFGYDTST